MDEIDEQKPSRVLVVDDDPDMLSVTTGVLQQNGYPTREAVNGRAALEMLLGPRGGDVRLVLTDIQMPIMDGIALARSLRERGLCTPVVMMTGLADDDLKARGIDTRAVLHKPFTMHTLLRAVEAIIGPARTLPPPK